MTEPTEPPEKRVTGVAITFASGRRIRLEGDEARKWQEVVQAEALMAWNHGMPCPAFKWIEEAPRTDGDPLPCPFCGSTRIVIDADLSDSGVHQAVCSECCAMGPIVKMDMDVDEGNEEQQAFDLWNMRTEAPK